MKLIPDFFLQSVTRLLLFQAFIGWLVIRKNYMELPQLLDFALSTTLGTTVSNCKELLDFYAGFELPWEASFFLPVLFDGYITNSMPELADLLGGSPCHHTAFIVDGKPGGCTESLAYNCYQHASSMEYGETSFELMDICYQDFAITTRQATRHVKHCHDPNSRSDLADLAACIRAKTNLAERKNVSSVVAPVFECTMIYAKWDVIAPMMGEMGLQLKTHGVPDYCFVRTNPKLMTVFSSLPSKSAENTTQTD